MSFVRSLSIKISDVVVQYASPGCKDWAEGLAREVAFIESDWSALRWALGSVRILLDRREAPFASLSDVEVAAKKLIEQKRNARFFWAIWLFNAVIQLIELVGEQSGLKRAGVVCMTVSFAYMAIEALREQRRWAALLKTDGTNDVLLYKAELERLGDLFKSWREWLSVVAVTLMFAGVLFTMPAKARIYWVVFYVLLIAVGLVFGRYTRRASFRKLARLNELLARDIES